MFEVDDLEKLIFSIFIVSVIGIAVAYLVMGVMMHALLNETRRERFGIKVVFTWPFVLWGKSEDAAASQK